MEDRTGLATNQTILIVTGMHRSGTSLVAALLQSMGLDIGHNLLEANYSNPKGFFENTDFLNFHELILSSLGINPIGWTVQDKIVVPEGYIGKARQLVENNASATKAWGWKEPRTTLFLNFWSHLLPDARFLLIYRNPWEVLDSLYRRGDDVFYKSPEFALEVWIAYNEKILEFCSQNPEKCLLVNINSVTSNPKSLLIRIQEKFGICLTPPNSQIYDASLLKNQVSESVHPYIIKEFFPKAFDLYDRLNSMANLREEEEGFDLHLVANKFLRNWADIRFVERNTKAEVKQCQDLVQQLYTDLGQSEGHLAFARNQVTQLQTDLSQSEGHLAFARNQVTQLQQELSQSNQRVDQLQAEISGTQQQLHQMQIQLQQTQGQLTQLQQKSNQKIGQLTSKLQKKQSRILHLRSQLEESQSQIQEMESSKFWRLRQRWFQLKQKFSLIRN